MSFWEDANGYPTHDRQSFFAGLRAGLALGRAFIVGLISKFIRSNGTYHAADEGADGYSMVTVDVPNTYTAADEGKVVQSGALAAQTALTVTENGIYDTTAHNPVTVNVAGGGGGRLPSTYQEVEYLELDGRQFSTVSMTIPRYTVIISRAYLIPNPPSTYDYGIIGKDGRFIQHFRDGRAETYWAYSGAQIQPTIHNAEKGAVHTISGFPTADIPSPVLIGRTTNSNYFIGRIYGIEMIEAADNSSALAKRIFQAIPCYRKSDSVAGFYDPINRVFYENEGTGAFGSGADVN